MTFLTEWALANTAMALVLAVPAYFSTHLRRPALTHALWLLVLLRLIAPPLWRVELPSSAAVATDATPSIPAATTSQPALTVIGDDSLQALIPVVNDIVPEPVSVPPALAVEAPAATWNWSLIAAVIWASGAVACAGLALTRVVRFQRILQYTRAAPDGWRSLAGPIAERMGLLKVPEIRLIPGSVAPLLWAGFGKPVLLIPADLADRLDDDRRKALIAHELAHLRRGDQYVRWLELMVTAIYWWNPAVWLARRELREAEEQLCDAWVVWVMPDARRAYATALVDTVDFLSEARPALPPLASGLGEVRNLERRVVMILQGHAPRQLTRLAMCSCLAVGIGLLTLSPGRADDEPPAPPPPPKAPIPPGQSEGGPKARERRMDPARAEEAEQIRAEIRKMHESLGRLEGRLAELEGRPAARGIGEARGPIRARAGMPPDAPPPPVPPGAAATAPAAPGRFGGMNPGGFPGGGGGGFGGGAPGGMGGQGPNFDRRLEEMQRAIERLSQQMEEMRRMVGDRRGPGREGTPPPRGERP